MRPPLCPLNFCEESAKKSSEFYEGKLANKWKYFIVFLLEGVAWVHFDL